MSCTDTWWSTCNNQMKWISVALLVVGVPDFCCQKQKETVKKVWCCWFPEYSWFSSCYRFSCRTLMSFFPDMTWTLLMIIRGPEDLITFENHCRNFWREHWSWLLSVFLWFSGEPSTPRYRASITLAKIFCLLKVTFGHSRHSFMKKVCMRHCHGL